MSLQALIFDVDGTLAETEDVHRRAFNEAFKAAGLGWCWDPQLYRELLSVMGGKERLSHFLSMADPTFMESKDAQQRIRALHKSKTDYYVEFLNNGSLSFRPGIVRLLFEAQEQGILLAIATTTSPENVTALLKGGLGPSGPELFQSIVAGDAVPKKKPAPDVYLQVLQELNCSPKQCVAFEDSQSGLASATAAGIPTFVTLSEFTTCSDHSDAKAVLSHLGEPHNPCEVISGNIGTTPYVSLEYLGSSLKAA
ncbi:MAG: HAD family hydrolase [Rhodospirillales bacterium]|nr:HAD family hydrolase [Rhodospirillales bacterium]